MAGCGAFTRGRAGRAWVQLLQKMQGLLVLAMSVEDGMSAKERPIIFSAPMVEAILEGRKTQTRRIVKPQPVALDSASTCIGSKQFCDEFCFYGRQGVILYVKETHWRFGHWVRNGKTKTGKQAWKFQPDYPPNLKCSVIFCSGCKKPPSAPPPRGSARPGWWKRPAIFLPASYSRIKLGVVSIGIQRVQDITEEDARAEGCGAACSSPPDGPAKYRIGYSLLWDSIYGKGSGAENPWVWKITFKRV